jgi:hypothetical protein
LLITFKKKKSWISDIIDFRAKNIPEDKRSFHAHKLGMVAYTCDPSYQGGHR